MLGSSASTSHSVARNGAKLPSSAYVTKDSYAVVKKIREALVVHSGVYPGVDVVL